MNAVVLEQETSSDEYHLVNSKFELSDKTKQITVIFRLHFNALALGSTMSLK